MNKYRNMKIRTYGSKELSTAIQKKLFRLGYRWHDWRKSDLRPVEGWFLCAGDTGTMCFGCVCGDPEVTIDELMQMRPEPRETVTIGDAIYDKAEFEEATKNLKPIK